jgi:hypothetical protein
LVHHQEIREDMMKSFWHRVLTELVDPYGVRREEVIRTRRSERERIAQEIERYEEGHEALRFYGLPNKIRHRELP